MNKKGPIELEKERTIKIVRALIRLKYSLKADEELNNILPDLLDKFDAAVQRGELVSAIPEINDILEDL